MAAEDEEKAQLLCNQQNIPVREESGSVATRVRDSSTGDNRAYSNLTVIFRIFKQTF